MKLKQVSNPKVNRPTLFLAAVALITLSTSTGISSVSPNQQLPVMNSSMTLNCQVGWCKLLEIKTNRKQSRHSSQDWNLKRTDYYLAKFLLASFHLGFLMHDFGNMHFRFDPLLLCIEARHGLTVRSQPDLHLMKFRFCCFFSSNENVSTEIILKALWDDRRADDVLPHCEGSQTKVRVLRCNGGLNVRKVGPSASDRISKNMTVSSEDSGQIHQYNDVG